jgi:hypothetical protein
MSLRYTGVSTSCRVQYQEWPFEGFLKRTRIGNGIMYSPKFKFSRVSERFILAISVETFGTTGSSEDAPAKTVILRKVTVFQIPRSVLLRHDLAWRTLRGRQEDKKLYKIKKDGYPWKQIFAAFLRE